MLDEEVLTDFVLELDRIAHPGVSIGSWAECLKESGFQIMNVSEISRADDGSGLLWSVTLESGIHLFTYRLLKSSCRPAEAGEIEQAARLEVMDRQGFLVDSIPMIQFSNEVGTIYFPDIPEEEEYGALDESWTAQAIELTERAEAIILKNFSRRGL